MLARLLDWYVSTPNPIVAGARAFVRRHPGLRSSGLAMVSLVLAPRAELARWLRGAIDPKLQAVMDARQIGGSLAIADLEQVWEAAGRARRVLCIGDAPELDQVEIVLRAANPSAAVTLSLTKDLNAGKFDLIVEVARVAPAQAGNAAVDQPDGTKIIRIGRPGAKRADQHGVAVPRKPAAAGSLREKLARGDPLHVVILNDCGFRFGAGIAARRQAASFLLKGWKVSLVTWAGGESVSAPAITGVAGLAQNFAVQSVPDVEEVIRSIAMLRPDLVMVGTLHGSAWPIGIISRLRATGVRVAAYMHDCYFVTGRCVHMGPCTKFVSGCDAECPTADERPRLARDRIAAAWRERADIFTGPEAVPLIANSRWTEDVVKRRFADAARTDVVHLGLDHDLFAPMAKSAARRLLALPQDKTIVAMGAFDVGDRWKGGPLFQELHKALLERGDIAVILLGESSERLASERSFGRVTDERLMPLILNSADIFVSAAIAESFGQMLLEASACAVPVVALDVGGVRDVVAREETGILIEQTTPGDLLAGVERLIADPKLGNDMGRRARARVESQFTLMHQAEAWIACLRRLC